MLPVEWIVPVVAAVAGSVVVTRRSLLLLARLRGREVPARLTCPEHGCRVHCTLLVDNRRGRYVGVQACSMFPGGIPRCEQACVRLLDLGMPLHRPPDAEAPAPPDRREAAPEARAKGAGTASDVRIAEPACRRQPR